MRRLPVALVCCLVAGAAFAERPVYRNLDVQGGVTYSDRPAGAGSTRVKNYQPPEPSSRRYRQALTRADIEALQYQRLYAENRSPGRVVLFDPRGVSAPTPQGTAPAYRVHVRLDPNLPDSPAPSTERRYYYGGR